MSTEQINRKLAEWVGWEDVYGWGIMVNYERAPGHINQVQAHWKNGDQLAINLPNYAGSLDAVAEVEARLTPEQLRGYCRELESLVRTEGNVIFPRWREVNPSQVIDVLLIRSTALQRCTALCRTLGLWEDV